jgi:hypothetical protein
VPENIAEPTGALWQKVKTHPGVVWPKSDEGAMAELSVAWKNAGLGFTNAASHTNRPDDTSWPDQAGSAFVARRGKLDGVSVKVGQAMQEVGGLAKGYADDVRHTKDQISKVVSEAEWDYKWMRVKAAVNPFADLEAELEKLCATVAEGLARFISLMAARIRARGQGKKLGDAPTIAKDGTGNSLADRLGGLATVAETASLFVPSPHLKAAAVVLNAAAAVLHVAALKDGVTQDELTEIATDALVGKGALKDRGDILTTATKEADTAWKYVTNDPTAQKGLQTGTNIVTNDGVLKEETRSGEQYDDEKEGETYDKFGIGLLNEGLDKVGK